MRDRVREMLEQTPAKAREIAERLGVPMEKVQMALHQLCAQTGGFAAVPWSARNERVYATVKWIKENDPSKAEVAQPITIRPYRWPDEAEA